MRGRITVPDLLFYLVAAAAVAGLYPVYQGVLGGSGISGNLLTLFQTFGPAMALVLLATIAAKAGVGPK